MVLETIDAINSEQIAAKSLKQNDPSSPLSVTTQGNGFPTPKQVQESRDAAVATPCDSIRMYADDLAPSTSASGMVETGRQTPCESIQDYANELTASISKSTNGEDTSAPNDVSAPVSEKREEAEDAGDATPLADVPTAGDPLARMASVRSELSGSQVSGTGRATLITVSSSSEERSPEMGEKKQPDGEELQITDSVEVVALQEEEVPAVEEAKSETKSAEESEAESVTIIEETKVENEETTDDAKPAQEPDNKANKDIAAATESEVNVEEQTAAESKVKDNEEAPTEQEEQPEPDCTADDATPPSENETKKKKFALPKLSRKPSISKPNISVPTLPKKPTSPKAGNLVKGLSKPNLSKPNLSKPNLPKPSLSKAQLSKRFAKPSLGKRSKNKADDSTPVPQAAEEDLKADEPSSPPAVETKQSCSAFFVEQNNSMQVREAEMLETTKEVEDEEVSLPEVQVKPQVTEIVTKAPEAEAAEVAATAAAAGKAPEEEISANMNIQSFAEGMFHKFEDCFGDVTELCGPKSKKADTVKKATSKEDATVTDESAVDTTDKPAVISDDCTQEPATKKTLPALETNDDGNAPAPPLSALSIATERAQSFVGEIMHNPSMKSFAESLQSAAKQAEEAIFSKVDDVAEEDDPVAGSSPEKTQQDKLDVAAEMAKRALDEGACTANEDDNLEVNTDDKESSNAAAPKRKLFGLKGKSQHKIFAPKQPPATPDGAQAEDAPTGPASPSRRFSIKRGFSTKAKSSAGKVDNAPEKVVCDSKKSAASSPFRRFKNPVGLVNRKRSNSKAPEGKQGKLSQAETDAAIVTTEEVKGDLVQSTSLNSQSLDEPRTSKTDQVPQDKEPQTEDIVKDNEAGKQNEVPVDSLDEEPNLSGNVQSAPADELAAGSPETTAVAEEKPDAEEGESGETQKPDSGKESTSTEEQNAADDSS